MADERAHNASARTKSPKAFRTISEAANELDLPQHVLRFWETKFPQIKPMKRAGGRRFYRPEDVELLTRIKTLLHTEGYTIKGVQKLLRHGNGGQTTVAEKAIHPTPNTDAPSVTDGDQHRQLRSEINNAIRELESARTDLMSARKTS